MNLVLTCSACGAVFRVLQSPEGADVSSLLGPGSDFWPDHYECPRCGAPSVAADEESMPRSIQNTNLIDLSAEEMYAALHGLGLPNENKATLDVVNRVLQEAPIKRMVGQDVPNTDRCSVDYIELANGTRIYLGASVHGAVVYRVVGRPTYAERVIKEEEERGSHL